MADSKITGLSLLNPAQANDELVINRAGVDGKVTAGSVGAVSLPAFRGALIYRSADFSCPNNVFTALPFDLEVYDTDNMHDNVTNNTRITLPAGPTLVRPVCNVYWLAGSTGVRVCEIYKNGAQYQGGARTQAFNTGTTRHVVINAAGPVTQVNPAGGDFFEVLVLQDNGAALTISANQNTWFALEIVR